MQIRHLDLHRSESRTSVLLPTELVSGFNETLSMFLYYHFYFSILNSEHLLDVYSGLWLIFNPNNHMR